MASYDEFCKSYGIKPLPVDEEFRLPKYEKQTRNNKMKIIDTCDHAAWLINQLKVGIKTAPVLDDEKHAALMQEITNKVDDFYKALEAAYMVGRR